MAAMSSAFGKQGPLGAVQNFIERETARARNEYFEVKDEAAIGLPKGE